MDSFGVINVIEKLANHVLRNPKSNPGFGATMLESGLDIRKNPEALVNNKAILDVASPRPGASVGTFLDVLLKKNSQANYILFVLRDNSISPIQIRQIMINNHMSMSNIKQVLVLDRNSLKIVWP